MGLFSRKEDDPDLVVARADAEGALPEGWTLLDDDREGFLLSGPGVQISLDVWAAAARGPNDELELAVASDRAGAFHALARRLRGDLDTSDGWAPPLQSVERH